MRPLWITAVLLIIASLVFLFFIPGGDRTAMGLLIVGCLLNLIDQRLRSRAIADPQIQA